MNILYTAVLVLIPTIMSIFSLLSARKKWDPRGKHCYVTGGSAGLGLSLAILLTKKGANVSIVARNEKRLKHALEEMEKVRQSPDQLLKVYSYSLIEPSTSAAAFDAACQVYGGKMPDAVFLCAGAARPGFFLEQDEASLRQGMEDAYWVQAWSAFHAAKRMANSRSGGKIVFVSSTLGYMSILGYSTYAAGKHALRGLAETLRSELQLYSISVHIYFPGTIYSPGYVEENKTKPPITLKIEEGDEGCQPDQAAEVLLQGVQKGNFHITSDFIGELMRTATQGATPHNGLLDTVLALIGRIGLTFWRRGVDKLILDHRTEHMAYLTDKGILSS